MAMLAHPPETVYTTSIDLAAFPAIRKVFLLPSKFAFIHLQS